MRGGARRGVEIGRLAVLTGPACIMMIAMIGAGTPFFPAGPAVATAQTLEDQVYAIARELMCPVCGGQTVAESSSQLAVQMRDEIRDRLRAGQTREEIIAYFVGQFGEGVLAAPPARGSALLLWLAPPLALAAGVAVLILFVRRHLAVPRAA